MVLPAVELAILIDDNDIDLFVQRRFIEINHFAKRVITYNSATLAVSYLKSVKDSEIPDLIFLDLNMPEMDGFGFLDNFKKFPQLVKDKTKVVVITSSSNLSDKEKAGSFGAVIHFMSKPLSEEALKEIRDIFATLSNPKFVAF